MRHPFLLLQSRNATDPMREEEVACFADALGVPARGIHVVDMLRGVPTAQELAWARGVLMGGSGDYSCLDPFPWIARMVGYVREVLLPSGVPTFASCFGLQVTSLALGGTMVRDPARRELGTIDLDRSPAAAHDPLFGSLPPAFAAQAGHNDRADGVPPGADLLASSEACPVNAFRVRGRPYWATQFHPELDPNSFARRYMIYVANYPPADLPPGAPIAEAPFLRGLRPSPHATRLLQRFAQFCRSRALPA